MKVTMFWHGGINYAAFDTTNPQDAEVFNSIDDAIEAFRHRAEDFDPYYPLVDNIDPANGGPSAWIFYNEDNDPVLGQEYPDEILEYDANGNLIHQSV